MVITTTDKIPNKEILEILGIARGSTVRAKHIGKDIFAGLKNIVGGEINEYTKLDPTLPRITNIDCSNQDCDSNRKYDSKEDKAILYIRYDDTNMKFIYLCSICDTIWATKTK